MTLITAYAGEVVEITAKKVYFPSREKFFTEEAKP
jgi:hypothetical protein